MMCRRIFYPKLALFVVLALLQFHPIAAQTNSPTYPPGTKGFVPQEGFVPDQETVLKIADAILTPIYSKSKIESEKPFTATLDSDVWIVRGHLDKGLLGGVAEVHISKKSGAILFVMHGM